MQFAPMRARNDDIRKTDEAKDRENGASRDAVVRYELCDEGGVGYWKSILRWRMATL